MISLTFKLQSQSRLVAISAETPFNNVATIEPRTRPLKRKRSSPVTSSEMSDEPSQVIKAWEDAGDEGSQEYEGDQEGGSDDHAVTDNTPLSETEKPVDVSDSRTTTQVSCHTGWTRVDG